MVVDLVKDPAYNKLFRRQHAENLNKFHYATPTIELPCPSATTSSDCPENITKTKRSYTGR